MAMNEQVASVKLSYQQGRQARLADKGKDLAVGVWGSLSRGKDSAGLTHAEATWYAL
jgi:hypothetical protein